MEFIIIMVNVREAQTQLSRLLERVHAGEEIVIAKAGKPFARLMSLELPPERVIERYHERDGEVPASVFDMPNMVDSEEAPRQHRAWATASGAPRGAERLRNPPEQLTNYQVDWKKFDASHLDELQKQLAEAVDESKLLIFLATDRHVLILGTLGRMRQGAWVINKEECTSIMREIDPCYDDRVKYIPDFLIGVKDYRGFLWTLVILKSPSMDPLLETGKIRQELRDTVGQIYGWRKWLTEHAGNFESRSGCLGISEECPGIIVIGRRAMRKPRAAETPDSARKRNDRLADYRKSYIEVMSYDRVVEYYSQQHRIRAPRPHPAFRTVSGVWPSERPSNLPEALINHKVDWGKFNDSHLSELQELVRDALDERPLQQFLAHRDHRQILILGILGQMAQDAWVSDRPTMGRKGGFIPDFIIGVRPSTGFVWTFVELESPRAKPLNKDGAIGSSLHHAIGQILDWRRWLRIDPEAGSFPNARGFEGISSESPGVIIIGKGDIRERANEISRDLLWSYEKHDGIKVLSYDQFVADYNEQHWWAVSGFRHR